VHEALQVGAVGAILGLADAFPDLCVEIYEAAGAGDRTRAQTLAQKLVAPSKMLLMDYGIAGLKYAMERLGFYGGLPRPPLLGVSDAGKLEIEAMLANLISQPAHHL
jgi:4-hydroxy-2-oxoglutarate aldolase